MKRPFEKFTGSTNNFIDLLFTDAYSPQDRKKLYQREYLRRGLEACNGNRDKTAAYLGMSIRCLRNQINSFPELKTAYPTYNGNAIMKYQKRKSEYLAAAGDFWLPSKKAKIIKDLNRIAKECGVDITALNEEALLAENADE